MSGQKESAGGSPGKDSKEEKKAKKLAQQKAEKKARIAAVKEAKKAEEEKPKDELPHSLETSPQYTSDSEEENLLLSIAAEILKKPENLNSQESQPRFPVGGVSYQGEDDLNAPAVIRHQQQLLRERRANDTRIIICNDDQRRTLDDRLVADYMVQMASGVNHVYDKNVDNGNDNAVNYVNNEDVGDNSDTDESLAAVLDNHEQQDDAAAVDREAIEESKRINKAGRRNRYKKRRQARERQENNGGDPSERDDAEAPAAEPQALANLAVRLNDAIPNEAVRPDDALPNEAVRPDDALANKADHPVAVLADQAVRPDDDNHKDEHDPKKHKKNKKKVQPDQNAEKPVGEPEKTPGELYRELFGDDVELSPGSSKNKNALKPNVEPTKDQKTPVEKKDEPAKNPKKPQEKKDEPKKDQKKPVEKKDEPKKDQKSPVKKEESKDSIESKSVESNEAPVLMENGHADTTSSSSSVDVKAPPTARDKEHDEKAQLLAQAVKKLEQLEIQMPDDDSSDNEFTLVTSKRKKYESGSSSNVSQISKNSPVVQENGCGSPRAYEDRNHSYHQNQNSGGHQPYRKSYYDRTFKRRDQQYHQTPQKPMYNNKAASTPQMTTQEFPPLPKQVIEKKSTQQAATSAWNKQKDTSATAPDTVGNVKTPWANHVMGTSTVVNGGKTADNIELPDSHKEDIPTAAVELNVGIIPKTEESAIQATAPTAGPDSVSMSDGAAANKEQENPKKNKQQKSQRWKPPSRNDDRAQSSHSADPVPQHYNLVPNGIGNAAPFPPRPVETRPPRLQFRLFDIKHYREDRNKLEQRLENHPAPGLMLIGYNRHYLNTHLTIEMWDELLSAKYNPNIAQVFHDIRMVYETGTGIAGTSLLDAEGGFRTSHSSAMGEYSTCYSDIIGVKCFNNFLKEEEKLIEHEDDGKATALKDIQMEIENAKKALMKQAGEDPMLTDSEKELIGAILFYDTEKTAQLLRTHPAILPEGNLFRCSNIVNKMLTYFETCTGISVFHLLCATKKKEHCGSVEQLFVQVPREMIIYLLNLIDGARRNGLHFTAIGGCSHITALFFPYLRNSVMNGRDALCCTPLDYAVQRNAGEIVRLLQWAGADLTIGPFVTLLTEARADVELRKEGLSYALAAWVKKAYIDVIPFGQRASAIHFVKFEPTSQGQVEFEIPKEFLRVAEQAGSSGDKKVKSLYLTVQPMKYTCMDFEMPAKHPHVILTIISKNVELLDDVKIRDNGGSHVLPHFMCTGSAYAYSLPPLTDDRILLTFKMDEHQRVPGNKAENLILAMQIFSTHPEAVREPSRTPTPPPPPPQPVSALDGQFVQPAFPHRFGPGFYPFQQPMVLPPQIHPLPVPYHQAQHYNSYLFGPFPTPNMNFPPPPHPHPHAPAPYPYPTGTFPPVNQNPH